MMNTALINRHVAAVAIQFGAYATPLESIVKYVAMSMGDDAPDMARLLNYLAKAETHDELAANYEVGLWCGPGRIWRLVSLSTPPTLEAIEHRLNSYPDSVSTQCAWCLIDEKNHYATELIKVFDLHNKPIHRRVVHRQCFKPFTVMLQQYERVKK